jgi:hypothetical protein
MLSASVIVSLPARHCDDAQERTLYWPGIAGRLCHSLVSTATDNRLPAVITVASEMPNTPGTPRWTPADVSRESVPRSRDSWRAILHP